MEEAPTKPLSRSGVSLKENFAWTLVARIIYAMSQWGVLVVVAKLGGATMLGELTLSLAIVSPVFVFPQLNLRAFQATDARDEFHFGDYLILRLATSVVALSIVVGILTVTGYERGLVQVALGIALYKTFEAISDVFYGLQQRHERMRAMAISIIARGVTAVITVGSALWLTGSLQIGVYSTAAVWLAILLAIDVPASAKLIPGGFVGSISRIWLLAIRALPLGIVALLVSLTANIPVYSIDHYLGREEVGFYSGMVYFLLVGQFVAASLAQAAAPRLARHHVAGDERRYFQLLWRLRGIGAAMAAFGIVAIALFGRELLMIAYGPAFVKYTDVFIWVMVAAGIGYAATFLGSALTVARGTGRCFC